MGLDNYILEAEDLAGELRESLQEAEIEALHQRLSGWAIKDWINWRMGNQSLVSEFVAATPSERDRKKRFREHRLYLTMAGIQHCLEAHALLSVISDSCLEPGESYRSMTARAGNAHTRLLLEFEVPYWPFDDYVESPFEDDPVNRRDP